MKEWELFCALIGRDDMAFDERFATNRARLENNDELEAQLSEALKAKTTAEWMQELQEANVASLGKVNTITDLFIDPHVQARNMLVDVPLPYGMGKTLKLPNSPLHLSGTPTVVGQGMPGQGEHTESTLRDWLGMGDAEIGPLRERGVIK
ncbi:MAG: CoA transferase [Dehalococcoidia bacterium]|nr:CoA transferase [Dehalococcoidia bacterium]